MYILFGHRITPSLQVIIWHKRIISLWPKIASAAPHLYWLYHSSHYFIFFFDSFAENGIWDLEHVHVERVVHFWNCCPEPYPEIHYTLLLRRRPIFYVVNIILPCIFISALSLLVFILPAECGEKVSLSITNLLALVVFQQLIAETMPPSGDDPPIIGKCQSMRVKNDALLKGTRSNGHYMGLNNRAIDTILYI